ncbi:unnamed protein product [Phaedon cochleariae]|uniref:WHEP-TRS domain-containing protein n=1 Tax=Phaedon cochleariae TaxID=80249 RepID=A0A9N9SBY0_PHACE|nr:unnamed protein product [Phaedon cochleariae]
MRLFTTLRRLTKIHDILCNKLTKECPSYSATRRSVYISPSLDQWGKNKKHRNVKLNLFHEAMADPKIEEVLAPLRAHVKEQGDLVRKLKEEGAPALDVKKAVLELKARKKVLEDKELSLAPNQTFDRAKMEDLLKRRFFYDQSFAIYGGITGQFDFGPMGCAFKANLLQIWRQFFVLEEQMLEVDCSVLTPEPVLKASGHVDRFADLMVKDVQSGECFRLDHLIKAHLEKISADKKTSQDVRDECQDIVIKLDGMNKAEMAAVMEKFKMKSPLTGNELTEPIEFNLMFGTQIGPSGLIKGIQQFMVKCGVDPSRLRFRQHMANEMAHYACDCWDAECLTSYATGVRLAAEKKLAEPRVCDVVEACPNKGALGKAFKKDAKTITDALAGLKIEDVEDLERQLEDDGSYQLSVGDEKYTLNKDMVSVKKYQKTEHVEEIIPSVIEPSFVDDSSGSIGRRYARTDEIAIPYGITIDFDTLKEPHSVTLRERDSMGQVRIPLDDIAVTVHNLSYSKESWSDIERKYPKFEQQENKGV